MKNKTAALFNKNKESITTAENVTGRSNAKIKEYIVVPCGHYTHTSSMSHFSKFLFIIIFKIWYIVLFFY